MELDLESKISLVVKEVGKTNGMTTAEINSRLVIATKHLVKEISQGSEFHLSLNPPKHAQEKDGKFIINYDEVKKLIPAKDNKPKELKSSATEKSETKSTKK